MRRRGRARPLAILVVALAALAGSLVIPEGRTQTDRRPNIVVILTDDQTFDSLPHVPPVMPYLQARIEDPNDHWIDFPNAFLNTPLCCPSRATILSGRYSHETQVLDNYDGHLFDDSSTIATWLHRAGYTTSLVGKYLNGYPFGRGPFVPPGWSRWDAKQQGGGGTVYYDYRVIEQGFPVAYGGGPADYSTDVFDSLAVSFIRTAPADHPFFLYLAPTAPHPPWIPPPRYEDLYASMPVPLPPSLNEADVSDKPAWVRALPSLTPDQLAGLQRARRLQYETLRGVDDMVRDVVDALRQRRELNNTVIVYLTDNGFSFGEHRWVTKDCPYEECIRTPFFVRFPSALPRTDDHLISNVDLAPTIAELAGISPGGPVSGRSFAPLLLGQSPPDWRTGVLTEWVGDERIPPWWSVRTRDAVYVELDTGERELYDLRVDPFELVNQAGDPAYAGLQARLAAQLAALRAAG
jgi:N-acetylglucosamine-6-sulfatase